MIPRPGPVRWILEGISLDCEGGPWCCHLAADGSTISEIDSLTRINVIFNPKSPLAGTKVATQIFDSRMNLEHLCSCGCRTFGERTGIQGPNSLGRPKVFLPLRARPILMQPPVLQFPWARTSWLGKARTKWGRHTWGKSMKIIVM